MENITEAKHPIAVEVPAFTVRYGKDVRCCLALLEEHAAPTRRKKRVKAPLDCNADRTSRRVKLGGMFGWKTL
jgi:hypothetical protein